MTYKQTHPISRITGITIWMRTWGRSPHRMCCRSRWWCGNLPFSDAVTPTYASTQDYDEPSISCSHAQRIWKTIAGNGLVCCAQGDLNGDGEPEIIVATHEAKLLVRNYAITGCHNRWIQQQQLNLSCHAERLA